MTEIITYFFHTLTNVPVNEGTLRVQKVELVVQTTPRAGDGSGVRQHAKTASNLREISPRNVRRGLIADTKLETGRAPVDKLDGPLRLDDSNSSVNILGNDIAAVQECAGH